MERARVCRRHVRRCRRIVLAVAVVDDIVAWVVRVIIVPCVAAAAAARAVRRRWRRGLGGGDCRRRRCGRDVAADHARVWRPRGDWLAVGEESEPARDAGRWDVRRRDVVPDARLDHVSRRCDELEALAHGARRDAARRRLACAAAAVSPAAVAAAARNVRENVRRRAPRRLGRGRRCRGHVRGIVAVVVFAHVAIVVVFVYVSAAAMAMKARRTRDALDYCAVVGDRGDCSNLLWRQRLCLRRLRLTAAARVAVAAGGVCDERHSIVAAEVLINVL